MDNSFTEHTARLVDVNADRLHNKYLAQKAESKYDNLVNDIRSDFHNDYITEKAKLSDNIYELERFKYNANFYAMLRNGFLGLIIISLLLQLNILTPLVAYIVGGIIAFIMCIYWWVSMRYQYERRSGIIFNDYVANRSMDQPKSETCQ
jgi:uncharacterized membrane protein